jgi:ribosome biogenesis GTPase A
MSKIIQWFPGHMTKAMREMEEKRDLCDGVICVLDARAPVATLNNNLKKVFGEKPVLYLLNKCDLADGKADAFVRFFEEHGKDCAKCNAADGNTKRLIWSRLEKIVKEKRERAEAKGFTRTFRFMVAGIPNTGKSTIVNLISGQKRAKTGDKAGVTRDVRWLRCGSFDLLDTPGTMPPSFENQDLARHLAYIGSINDDILDLEDLAYELLGELAEKYPKLLTERYGIEDFSDKLAMYETLCKRRGFMLRGGDYDYERGAKALIDDFRKGRLGKICLEDAKDYDETVFLYKPEKKDDKKRKKRG